MKKRHHWCVKPDYAAECQDCSWTSFGPQGLGSAARHHDATLHTVRVGVESAVYYETYERDRARRGPAPLAHEPHVEKR
jgi:hypothetical protein